MNTKKIFGYGTRNLFFAFAAIIALTLTTLSLTGCPPEPHTHDWEWVETTPATPTADGLETETCKTCGETSGKTRPIPATGNPAHVHTYSAAWSHDATQHWRECTDNDGDKTDIANHTGDPCTVCGYTGTTHTHEYATTWSKDATQHWHECSCGDKTDVAAHQWGAWQETTAPTYNTDGEQTRTCATCGATETKAIAKLVSMIETVRVNGGSFQMGKNGNGTANSVTPVHEVTLAAFSIGKYEVTQKQWHTVMGTTIQQQNEISDYQGLDGVGDNYPMYHVNWYDAIEFCNALSVKEGLTPYYTIDKTTSDPNNMSSRDTIKWLVTPNTTATGYRLPTEAQWEYAAKGGASASDPYKIYSGSDTVGDVAWYWDNIPSQTSGETGYGAQEVGTKAANELGIHDMSGNVFEWCWDWYATYEDEAQTDPVGASSGSHRVVRGGGWLDPAGLARSAYRSVGNPNSRDINLGFRVLRPAE